MADPFLAPSASPAYPEDHLVAVPTEAVASPAAQRRRTRMNAFGNYVLMQTIGEGEFAKVKFAVHRTLSTEVAIKLIKKESIDSEAKLSKINREIMALKTVKHPHIVQLYEIIETDRYIGIVMEYASGGELFDYILAHRFLREKEAARLFAQLISGVDYLHKHHIVHRDLKLENLLLDSHRELKITDFGFANQFQRATEDLMATSCGSPCYAAPELVVNDGMYVGTAVDIWSCGVILYAMLAGYLPFDDDPTNPDGDNINQLYKYILTTPLVFPDYISTLARDLLRRMLVPDPAHRCDIRAIMLHEWLAPYSYVFDLAHPAANESMADSTVTEPQASEAAAAPGDPLLPDEEVRQAKSRKRHTIQVEYDSDALAAYGLTDAQHRSTTSLAVAVGDSAADLGEVSPLSPVSTNPEIRSAVSDEIQPASPPLPDVSESLATPESVRADSPLDPHEIPNIDHTPQLAESQEQPAAEVPAAHARENATTDSAASLGDVVTTPGPTDDRKPEVEIIEVPLDKPAETSPTAFQAKRRKAHSVLVTGTSLAALSPLQESADVDGSDRPASANPARRVVDWLRRKAHAPSRSDETVSENPAAAISGDQLPSTARKTDVSEDNPRLRLHRGAVDQDSLTTQTPDEIFQMVKRTAFSMGLEVYKETDYKLKCIRPARGGPQAPATAASEAAAAGAASRPSISHTRVTNLTSSHGVFSRLTQAIGHSKTTSLASESRADLPRHGVDPTPTSRASMDLSRNQTPPGSAGLPPTAVAATTGRPKRQSAFMRFLPFGQHSPSRSAPPGAAKGISTAALAKRSSAESHTAPTNRVSSPHSSLDRLQTTRASHDPIPDHRRNQSTGTVSAASQRNVSQSSSAAASAALAATATAGPRSSHDSSVHSLLNQSRDHLSVHSGESPRSVALRTITERAEPVYGELYVDAGGEVRLTIDICKLKNLPHLLTVRVRRQRGNIWSYKFLYNEFFKRLDLSGRNGTTDPVAHPAGDALTPSKRDAPFKTVGGAAGAAATRTLNEATAPPSRASVTFGKRQTVAAVSSDADSTTAAGTRSNKRGSIFHPSHLFSANTGVGRFMARSSTDAKHAPSLKEIFGPSGSDKPKAIKSRSDRTKAEAAAATTAPSPLKEAKQGDRKESASGRSKRKVSGNPTQTTATVRRGRRDGDLPPLTPILTAISPSISVAGADYHYRPTSAAPPSTLATDTADNTTDEYPYYRPPASSSSVYPNHRRHSMSTHSATNFLSSTRATLTPSLHSVTRSTDKSDDSESSASDTSSAGSSHVNGHESQTPSPLASEVTQPAKPDQHQTPPMKQKAARPALTEADKERGAKPQPSAGRTGRSRAHSTSIVSTIKNASFLLTRNRGNGNGNATPTEAPATQ
ncbi:hypothetical protein IWQ60_005441 [Tieghemiomyces parasiticus]|uniref:Non-specific serine/threonine protein kinase n=1 Tax=Tieghemiomyces parasiticus TaxID=78921 RepID=A0A9W8DY77_9FUNG|nr:hypothetical protein IWQ60_005441 [Tieghemiomyces parasiticus]